MLATVLLLGLVSVATATDLARHKIYNWTTYSGILAALGLNAAGTAWLAVGGADHGACLRCLGWIGVTQSMVGFLVCGLPMLVCFVIFKVGGGDVKLIAMVGSLVGYEQGIEAMLWAFVLGGCVGLIVLIWRVGAWRLIVRVLRQAVWTLRLGQWSPLTPAERAQLQPPLFLAPNVLAAVLIVRFSLVDYVNW